MSSQKDRKTLRREYNAASHTLYNAALITSDARHALAANDEPINSDSSYEVPEVDDRVKEAWKFARGIVSDGESDSDDHRTTKNQNQQATASSSAQATASSSTQANALSTRHQAKITDHDMSAILEFHAKGRLSIKDITDEIHYATRATIPKMRILALRRATQGIPLIRVEQWTAILKTWKTTPSRARDILQDRIQLEETTEGNTVLVKTHYVLKNVTNAQSVDDWLSQIFLKLDATSWAREWHAKKTRDPKFPDRMYRAIWAYLEQAQLGTADIESADAQRIFKSQLATSKAKEHKEIVARNRLLQMYSMFGAITLLDPTWEYRNFRNQTLGPTSQSYSMQYYERLHLQLSAEEREERMTDAEYSMINLVSAMTGEDQKSMQWIRVKMWELRRCYRV